MPTAASTDLRNSGPSGTDTQSFDRLVAPSSPPNWRLLGSDSLRGRRVLITGAGGSIGSALALATAASSPASLVLFDNSENGLYNIDRSLSEAGSRNHVPLLGDVCDAASLDHALTDHPVEIIFHAAALKHVPLMERNPFAAVEANVFGTHTLSQAATAHGVEQIVLVSTDKVVEPRSIMGAAKRVAELIVLSLRGYTQTKVVRLCNVMGSQGSVLPLFLEQIASGTPVTVTHPDAERYFLTMEDTVRVLFNSLKVATTGTLLLPDIRPAIRILGLAQYVIALHQSPATIAFTGLRPGDKVSEQLMSKRESLGVEVASGLRVIHTPTPTAEDLTAALDGLRAASLQRDLPSLLHAMKTVVPEYQPDSLILAACERETGLALATEMPG